MKLLKYSLISFLWPVESIRQVAYLSNTVSLDELSRADTEDILLHCRRYNSQNGITGILLYHNLLFFQIIEGESADIDLVYKRIEDDSRHRNVNKIIDSEVAHRSFGSWSMMFRNLDHTMELLSYAEKRELELFNEISQFAVTEPVVASAKVDRLLRLYEFLILRR